MKTFFPDLPLNSGLYRVIEVVASPDTVVSAKWPVAVTGFLMPFEKIMNSIYEIWSGIMPHRAISCTFNIEYLLTGGNDARRPEKPIFMFYDWLPGGWGGRNGKDGANVTQASFGTGMLSQPVEGQERGAPILTTEFEAVTDSGGPGKWRGGVGARKASILLAGENTVLSYICDRERAVVWGTNGGLPSMPHGLHLRRSGAQEDTWLGSVFSRRAAATGRPVQPAHGGRRRLRRSAGARSGKGEGGCSGRLRFDRACGHGLRGNPQGDRQGSLRYEVDREATKRERASIRAHRRGWQEEEPETVAAKYRAGGINALDAVRRYAVILDWGSGELLPNSTEQFREQFRIRSLAHWG